MNSREGQAAGVRSRSGTARVDARSGPGALPGGGNRGGVEVREVSGEGLAIYCADVGSIKNGNFGWAVVHGGQQRGGKKIGELADDVVGSLGAGIKVALGFECPLWVPVPDEPSGLTAGRAVDGNKTWCAGAGVGALATGLTETAWILRQIRQGLRDKGATLPCACLDWQGFTGTETGMFLCGRS